LPFSTDDSEYGDEEERRSESVNERDRDAGLQTFFKVGPIAFRMLECFEPEIDHRKLEDVEEDRTTECVNDRLGVGDERARDQHPRHHTERDQQSVFEWYFHNKFKVRFLCGPLRISASKLPLT